MRAPGPNLVDGSLECTLGEACVVQLTGFGLEAGNTLVAVSTADLVAGLDSWPYSGTAAATVLSWPRAFRRYRIQGFTLQCRNREHTIQFCTSQRNPFSSECQCMQFRN